jgi:AraC-like DNA-binding protein
MTAGSNGRRNDAERTVSAGLAKALTDFAVSRGADETRLYEASEISPDDLLDQDNRIPFSRYVALMRAAKALCDDPALALEFGAATDFRKFSVVGLIAHACANMVEALVQMNRYGRLIVEVEGLGDGPRFQLLQKDGELWMEDRRINPNEFPELTESAWSQFICGARKNFPHATFALAAHVTHPEPAHRADYDRLWRIPVTFGGDRNAIQVHPNWPSVKVEPESRYVFGVLSERAEALMKTLETSRTMRGQIENHLIPILHTGDIGIEKISGRMGMSRQTLYRRLKAEGVSFEGLLDELRRTMALHYLSGKKVSLNETAYLVGFSDQTAFSRAFKRWTGSSPRAMRASKQT